MYEDPSLANDSSQAVEQIVDNDSIGEDSTVVSGLGSFEEPVRHLGDSLARRQRKSTEVMHLRLVEWWDAYAAGQIQYPKLLERAATLMKPSKTWK